MTLKEYQEWHYKLWDYIAGRILLAKECLIIDQYKTALEIRDIWGVDPS